MSRAGTQAPRRRSRLWRALGARRRADRGALGRTTPGRAILAVIGQGARAGLTALLLAAAPAGLALSLASPALAVQPDEVLDDPALEARARALSAEIRCLVCRSESIDESNADLARDLRLLVRERLLAGDSDQEVKDFLVARYGEYVLLKPSFSEGNLALWFGGPALLLLGGIGAVIWMRRSRPEAAATSAPLSEAERARLAELLGEDDAARADDAPEAEGSDPQTPRPEGSATEAVSSGVTGSGREDRRDDRA